MSLLEAYRLIVVAACLSYASSMDLRTRMVNDLVWLVMVSLTAPAVLYEVYIGAIPLAAFMASAGLCFLLALAAHYIGLFGGADMVALWTLGLSIPVYPKGWVPLLGIAQPILSLAVFNNTIALAASTALYAVLRNVAYVVRRGGLFEGVEASKGAKLVAFLTGFKIETSKLDEDSPVFLLEEVGEGGVRRLKVSHVIRGSSRAQLGVSREAKKLLSEEAWVAPALPLIAYMLIGLATAITIGDLVTSLIAWLISTMPP